MKWMVSLLGAMFAVSAAVTALAGEEFMAGSDEPHGVVTSGPSQAAKNLFRVTIVEINGERIGERHSMPIRLTPGSHQIRAAAAEIGTRPAGTLSKTYRRQRPEMTLDLDIEEGKTYYIALQAEGQDRSQWRLVNWKTE